MKTEFYWKFIAFVLTIMLPQDGSGEKVWEIPFDKAKVRYHHSTVCITVKGETHCTSKNKAPGNPAEVAAMFNVFESVEQLSPNGDSYNETLLMPGAAKPKPKLPQYGSREKVWDIPFRNGQVHYEHSKVCVTVKGETQCTSKNTAPGNNDKMATMFKLLNEDSDNESVMISGKPKTKDDDYNGLFMEAIDVDDQDNVAKFFYAENCNTMVTLRDMSVKTIMVTTGVVHKCIDDVNRVLSDHGTVVVVGEDSAAVASAIKHIYDKTDLYYYKYYDLPKNIKDITSITYRGDLEIKAFITLATFIDRLRELISDHKYIEVLDIINELKNINKTIINEVYDEIVKNNDGYKLIDEIYKHIQNNGTAIIKDFPLEFQWLFNGDTVRLLNKGRNGMMSLDNGNSNHSWLLTKCDGIKDSHRLFKFNPVWNTSLSSVVFEIQNPLVGQKIYLDEDSIGNTKHRMAWGSRVSTINSNFKWRLKPALNENNELAFCVVNVFYDSYLSQGPCGSQLIAIKDSCTPDMGWIMDK